MTIFSSSVPKQPGPTISFRQSPSPSPLLEANQNCFFTRVSRSCLPALMFTLTVSEQACQSHCELLSKKGLRNLELFATGLALGTITPARLIKSGECSLSNASFQRQTENHRALRCPWIALPF